MLTKIIDDVGALVSNAHVQSVLAKKWDDEKGGGGYFHVLKDSAASIKAWETRGKTFHESKAGSIASAVNQLHELGKQYYATVDLHGVGSPKTNAAYGEWQKAKDHMMATHGTTKASISTLSYEAKKAFISAKGVEHPPLTSPPVTPPVPQPLAKKPVPVQSASLPTHANVAGPQFVKNETQAKEVLLQAHFDHVQGNIGDKTLASVVSTASNFLSKGQMAAMKAHATMKFKKMNDGHVAAVKAGLNKPAPLTSEGAGVDVTGFHHLAKDEAMRKLAESIGNKVYNEATADQSKALHSYVGSGYTNMNKVVSGSGEHELAKERAAALEQVLTHEVGVPMQLRRNMPQKWFWQAMGLPHDDAEQMKGLTDAQINGVIGKTFVEKAFSSTTYRTNSEIGFSNTGNESGFLDLRIRAPKETKGIFVDAFSPGESEVILQKGATYIIKKVTRKTGVGYKKFHYKVDVDWIGNTPGGA